HDVRLFLDKFPTILDRINHGRFRHIKHSCRTLTCDTILFFKGEAEFDSWIHRTEAVFHDDLLLCWHHDIISKDSRRLPLLITDPGSIRNAKGMLMPESAFSWVKCNKAFRRCAEIS